MRAIRPEDKGGTLQVFLADMIKNELERREWTYADLARESGMTEASVSNMLKNKRGGIMFTWQKMLDACDIRPEYWVTGVRRR